MSVIAGVLSAVASLASQGLNKQYNDETRREQNIFNKYEAQRAREWNQQMDSTKYQRTVNDMQQAGVNPALAMNGGVSTQATSNAQAQSAGQIPSNIDMTSAVQAALQAKQLQIQENLAKSQERKNNAEAEATEISNDYAAEYNQLRNEGQKLLNDLSIEQKKEITTKIANIEEATNLLKKQAATEEERKNLTMAEAALKRSMKDKTDAERQQIVELLPFQKAMMEAQTENQKAQATLAFINAAYQKKIIDSGYVDDMARKMKSEADSAEAFAAVNTVTKKLKAGDLDGFISDTVKEFKEGNIGTGVMRVLMGIGESLGTVVNSIIPDKLNLSGVIKK